MKYIRVKVKTLLVLSLVFIGLIFFSKNIYWKSIELYNGLVPYEDKISVSSKSTYSLKDEKLRLELMLTEIDYNLYQVVRIGEGMMSSGARINSYDALKVLEQFETFNVKGDLYEKEVDYVLNVILTQWFAGNVEETKDLLRKIPLDKIDQKQLSEYYLIQSAIHLAEIDLEGLEESLAAIEYKKYIPIRDALEDFVNCFYYGDFEDEVIDIAYDVVENDKYMSYFQDVISILRHSDNDFKVSEDVLELESAVSGYVTVNGKPLAGVFVYPKYSRGMSTFDGFDQDMCVTDANGYYELKNTKKHLKNINIALPWQTYQSMQLKSYRNFEVTENEPVRKDFQFYEGVSFKKIEVVDGFLEYEIYDPLASDQRRYYFKAQPFNDLSGEQYMIIDKAFSYSDLKGRVAVDDLRNFTDMPINYSSSSDPLALERFIEPLYLSGAYEFTISVSDEERDAFIWNGLTTYALSSVVDIEGAAEINEGDRLLADKKYEEAKAWYASHPTRHNLNVLVALYSRGTTIVEEEHWKDLTDAKPKEAIPYLEQLISTYGSTDRRRRDLADLYQEIGDYKNEEGVLLENLKYEPSVYDYFSLAYNYLNQGRYFEGINLLVEKGDMVIDGDRYYSYFVIGDQTKDLPEPLKSLLNALGDKEQFKPFYDLVTGGQTQEAYQWLLAQEESDLKNFYILNMFDSYRNNSWNRDAYEVISFDDYKMKMGIAEDQSFNEYYNSIYQKTNDKTIRKIYKLLREDSGWLNDY